MNEESEVSQFWEVGYNRFLPVEFTVGQAQAYELRERERVSSEVACDIVERDCGEICSKKTRVNEGP